jgi:hypothetical protein
VLTDNDGQRPCAQAAYCASATTACGENGQQVLVPAYGPRAFCPADRRKVGSAILELPRLYAHLATELGNPVRRESVVRSPFGPKVPLHAGIDALMRLHVEVLVSWHERIAVIANLSMPPERDGQGRATARDGWYVGRAVAVLSPRLDALLALAGEPMRRAVPLGQLASLGDIDGIVRSVYAATWPDLSGADAGLEILALRYRSRVLLGETRQRPVELLGVPCRVEDCDMLALRRAELPDGPDEDPPWSVCGNCGDVMTEAEYRDWTRRYARWAQQAS